MKKAFLTIAVLSVCVLGLLGTTGCESEKDDKVTITFISNSSFTMIMYVDEVSSASVSINNPKVSIKVDPGAVIWVMRGAANDYVQFIAPDGSKHSSFGVKDTDITVTIDYGGETGSVSA